MLSNDEEMELRAQQFDIHDDERRPFNPHWLTCTFCGRQSPPINNGGSDCPYCNSDTVYIEDEFAYADLQSKIEREESNG